MSTACDESHKIFFKSYFIFSNWDQKKEEVLDKISSLIQAITESRLIMLEVLLIGQAPRNIQDYASTGLV